MVPGNRRLSLVVPVLVVVPAALFLVAVLILAVLGAGVVGVLRQRFFRGFQTMRGLNQPQSRDDAAKTAVLFNHANSPDPSLGEERVKPRGSGVGRHHAAHLIHKTPQGHKPVRRLHGNGAVSSLNIRTLTRGRSSWAARNAPGDLLEALAGHQTNALLRSPDLAVQHREDLDALGHRQSLSQRSCGGLCSEHGLRRQCVTELLG
mmetsp:Transcript_83600/g.212889  ORF Transcript_83600/g.212889 Transcript_83600/m.212889 type:complete len:205 (-) Transcript_83600:1007-1621(-)